MRRSVESAIISKTSVKPNSHRHSVTPRRSQSQGEGQQSNGGRLAPFFGLALLIGLLVLCIGCPAPRRNNRYVGVILPLTGQAAAYGKSMQRGMDLALGLVNQSTSSQMTLFYEDSQGDPKAALSAYRSLVERYKVPAILGPFTSSEAFALAPVVEQDRVVMLSTGASAPSLTNAGDYVFRIVTSDSVDGNIVARFARENLSLSKIAIAYNNNDYGVGVKDAFSQRFQEMGGKVVLADGYSANDADYRTLLTRIKSLNPDALFIVGYKEMGKILRQARQLGITTRVLSTGLFEDPDILSSAGESAEGVYYSFASYNPDSTAAVIQDFVAAFKQQYNLSPDILAALGYDAVRIMSKALAEPGLHGDQIRDQLYRIQDFPGVTGETSFDQNGDVHKSFGIKQVKDGKFVWVVERF